MAKPAVPTGPISFGASNSKLSVSTLRTQLKKLAAVKLDRLDELLADGAFPAAIGQLQELSQLAKALDRSCTGLANKVNKKVWNPLLDHLQQDNPSEPIND